MTKTFETIISVLDKASAPILEIEEKLKGLGKVGAHMQKRLEIRPHQKLWRELNEQVHRGREVFGEFGEKLGDVGERIADVLPMLGGLGAAASVAGLVEMTHATAELAENLRNVAATAGMTVPQFQAFEFAAKRAGVAINPEQLTESFGMLSQQMATVASGQNKVGASLFKAMGINVKDAHGHLKSIAQILPQIENSFERTTNTTMRNRMARQLFGGREGEILIPFLAAGAKANQEAFNKFNKIGYGLSTERQEKLEKFQQSWVDLETSIEGVKNAISVQLGPVMAPLLEQFSKFIAKNRAWISLDIKGVIHDVATRLDGINWKKVNDGIKRMVHVSGEVIDKLGGLQGILLVAAGALTVTFLAPVVRANAQLLLLAYRMAAPMVASSASFVMAFATLVPSIGSVTDAFAALNAAMDANPLGAAITAAAILGALGWELYENWKTVKTFLIGIWEELGKRFHQIVDPIAHAWHDLVGPSGHAKGVAGNESPFQTRFKSFAPHANGEHLHGDSPVGPNGQTAIGQPIGKLDVYIHAPDGQHVTAGAQAHGLEVRPHVRRSSLGENTLLEMAPF